jgi:hypothetical protein
MTEQATTTPDHNASSTPNLDAAAVALKSNVIVGARELKDEMKHLAGDVAGEAKKTAESGLSLGKQRAADGLGSVANAIRKTGEHLREEDQGAFTEYFDRAARQVEIASDYLQRRSLGQVIGDVEQFARREPALFLGGAFVAGLIGGRFLKSSHPQPASAPRHDGQPAVGSNAAPSVRADARQASHAGANPAAPKAMPSTIPPPRAATRESSAPKTPGAQ